MAQHIHHNTTCDIPYCGKTPFSQITLHTSQLVLVFLSSRLILQYSYITTMRKSPKMPQPPLIIHSSSAILQILDRQLQLLPRYETEQVHLAGFFFFVVHLIKKINNNYFAALCLFFHKWTIFYPAKGSSLVQTQINDSDASACCFALHQFFFTCLATIALTSILVGLMPLHLLLLQLLVPPQQHLATE